MKYLGAAGLDMGATKITNMADGTAGTDATSRSQLDGKPDIKSYGGATYDVDTTADIFLRGTGDPAPTTTAGDIVITET